MNSIDLSASGPIASSLPTRQTLPDNATVIKPLEEEAPECPICLNEYDQPTETGRAENAVTVDCCRQSIGWDCLVHWLTEAKNNNPNMQGKCPLCRGEILTIEAYDDGENDGENDGGSGYEEESGFGGILLSWGGIVSSFRH
jgi:Ring finger domain